MEELIRGHNHAELGRYGDCPGCQNQMPDQINPDAPEGCTYTFEDNSIDGDFVCNRHGFFADRKGHFFKMNGTETIPCIAIQ